MSEPKIHKLKTVPPYFQDVASGIKTFEIRFDDRHYRVGDRLILLEYFPETNLYSGLEYHADVVYILSDFPAIQKGYVILGIKGIE